MKTKTYKKSLTLFYVFKLHDYKGKHLRDAQILAENYYQAKKEIRNKYPDYFNHTLSNTNDEQILNAEKYV